MNSLVYVIANNVNDKLYVGKTEAGFEKRWSRHQTAARSSSVRNRSHFKNAMRKHGEDKFYCAAQMQVSEECAQRLGVQMSDMLNDLETALIARLETSNADKGYNSTTGGDGARHTTESRAKISAANKGRKPSPETVEKIAAKLRGKPLSPEHRAKVSAALKGHDTSPATRAKIGAAHKGKKYSQERCEEMARIAQLSSGNLGHKHTEETRAKLSEITKEAMSDPGVRARLSAVAKERMKDPEMRRLASEGAQRLMADPEKKVRCTAAIRAISPEERRRRFGLATQARQTASSIRKRRFSQLLSEGKPIKDIASELGISVGYAFQVRTILRGSPCVTE